MKQNPWRSVLFRAFHYRLKPTSYFPSCKSPLGMLNISFRNALSSLKENHQRGAGAFWWMDVPLIRMNNKNLLYIELTSKPCSLLIAIMSFALFGTTHIICTATWTFRKLKIIINFEMTSNLFVHTSPQLLKTKTLLKKDEIEGEKMC